MWKIRNFTHNKSLIWNHYDSFRWWNLKIVWCWYRNNVPLILFASRMMIPMWILYLHPGVKDFHGDTWSLFFHTKSIRLLLLLELYAISNLSQLCDFQSAEKLILFPSTFIDDFCSNFVFKLNTLNLWVLITIMKQKLLGCCLIVQLRTKKRRSSSDFVHVEWVERNFNTNLFRNVYSF